MELSHGRYLTVQQAARLGVFDGAEALSREAPDKPWEVVMPVDVPVEQDGDGKDAMDAKEAVGTILGSLGPGLLSGVGQVLAHKDKERPADPDPVANLANPSNYDHGGTVKKTGLAMVHEGEKVIPAHHNVSLYRAMHHLNKGGLHRALGVPEGEDIPADKLEAAKSSKNEHVRRMASFAATMGHFQH